MANLVGYLFSGAAWWLWATLALLVAAYAYVRRDTSFALTDLSYTFPIIGKLARFSQDYSESSYKGWLNVEMALCRDYAKHISALSKGQFDNNILYLKKTYDHGRRPMPFWSLVMLASLVIMEGLGFSYILGSFMAQEGSENTRNLLMVAIVLVLATILVWVTHSAGHQLFRTGLLRNCFREFQTSGAKAFSSQVVSLDEDQHVDDRHPEHVQCANRMVSKPGDRGNHSWVWVAALLILAIAVGSTVLRIEMMHTTQIEDAQSPAAMFGSAPPPSPTADPAAAFLENAAFTGFAMLAVIFVVTQIVGMSLGYRYGFAGKQSRDARHATKGHADYDGYWEPIQRRINIANLRLHTLHRLLEKHSPRPLEFTKNFIDFIREERGRGARDLHEPPASREPLALPAPTTEAAADEAVAQSPEAAGNPAQGAETPEMDEDDVAEALRQWDLAETPDAKLDYLESLSPDLRERLAARIKRRKATVKDRETFHKKYEDLL